MTDLIVDDEYIRAIGVHYVDCSKKLQSAVDEYISTINKIKAEAVTSGKFKEALNGFLQYANALKDVISFMGSEIKSSCESYISEIDEKDKYLY